MKTSDFSIKKFNETLQEGINKAKTEREDFLLDFCKAIIVSDNKISVTLKPIAENNSNWKYVTLEKNEYSDFSEFYYGCSPEIDSEKIIKAISNSNFESPEELDKYINNHASHFMIHKGKEEYLDVLAKLILINLASKYGICIKRNEKTEFLVNEAKGKKDIYSEIIKWDNTEETNSKKKRRKSKKNTDDEKVIRIHGCPTKELKDLLNNYKFINDNGLWDISDNGIDFKDIYKDEKNIHLLDGRVFYSGVLIKPIKFSEQTERYENTGIKNIEILYERSTFATVCAFDDNNIDHPLLKDSKVKLQKMFIEDDFYKANLYDNLNKATNDTEILKSLNQYLDKSFNVNQIGVSGNIVTSDKKIFFGTRDKGNIDAGKVYPGVNGNAEIYDEKVNFYNYSAYEDLPSVSITNKRNDLLGEISREAYGELRLNQRKEAWECYGIVVSGTNSSKVINAVESFEEKHKEHLKNNRNLYYDKEKRRFHFNLIFETEVDDSFEDIMNRQKKASEAFENKNFISFFPLLFKNRLTCVFSFIWKIMLSIVSNKDFFEALILIFVAFSSFSLGTFVIENATSIPSLIFAGLILVSSVSRLGKLIKKGIKTIKTNKFIILYKSDDYNDINKKILKKLGTNFHPVAYAALKLYLENRIREQLDKK